MSIIIGIDHGYYAIKTAHCSFPAGLTSYERIATEQAAEENADVDSGEPDGTEMEVDAQY